MKKLFICCLLAGCTTALRAQFMISNYAPGMSKSDQVFDAAFPGTLRHRFLIDLDKGNRVDIQVNDREQFQKLLNIDSIIQLVLKAVEPLKDSLDADELASRRIDFATDLTGIIKMRTKIYPQNASHYVVKPNELAALKLEQDTIVLYGFLTSSTQKVAKQGIYKVFPYRIRFFLNNYKQLAGYLNGNLASTMEQIRSEWNTLKAWSLEANRRFNLYGYYNLADPSKNRRLRNTWTSTQLRTSIAPYVHIGVQAINGRFSPSVAAGIEFIRSEQNITDHYQLYWEPYFYFSQENDKTKVRRNDFISFQHVSETRDQKDKFKITYNQIFSVGYLVHRDGNYLNANTFKFGLPGARYRDMFVHPEFVFNNFFKNFQPSLKMMIYLD